MAPQVLDARYVDLQKLVNLLSLTFGAGNFEVKTEVRPIANTDPSRARDVTETILEPG